MLRGLYTSWTGMINEQKRLDVVSNNMANSATIGYKKEKVSSQAFDKLLTIKIRDGSQAYHNQSIGKMSLGVKVGETFTDYDQGSIRQSSNKLDVAISGKGFFTVAHTTKEGESVTRYTRDGSFNLTKEGILVDSEGNHVQGQSGDIVIDPASASDVVIDRDGSIQVNGETIDKLQITDFENYDYLVKKGDNYYSLKEGGTAKDADGIVLQGYTEQSNVNVVQEMVDMITITRAYEGNQKMIRTMDSMMDKAVNQVGRIGS